MRFIRSTEGPQVRDRVPTTLAAHDAKAALKAVESHDDIRTDEAGNIELELSPAELGAPIDKLAELLGIAVELDAGGQHLLAARIRAALTNSELSAKYRAALDQLAG